MNNWEYGGFYKELNITEKSIIRFDNGSIVAVHDIFEELPKFMYKADVLFTDPPWNLGNLNSFYTKADRKDYKDNYEKFYRRLFECIAEIKPRTCYLEIGKDYLAEFIFEMRKLYKYVTFYNSTYYHQKNKLCYIVRGSDKYKKLNLDYIDEEDIIEWVCANEEYDYIGDLCIGLGLVGVNAYKNGRRFVGTDLNHKRIAVLVKRIKDLGGEYQIYEREAKRDISFV